MEIKQRDLEKEFFVEDKAYFHSDMYINIASSDVKEILSEVFDTILEKTSIYLRRRSGWYFKEVLHLKIHTVEFNPLRGSSYLPLPDWIMRKKAILNIQNTDDKCFLWCVLRYLNPKPKKDERITDLKQKENTLNTKGIIFPMKLKDIQNLKRLILYFQK